MARQQQRKGADGERELAGILQENGYNVKRGGSMTYGTVPDIIGLPGIHIEVKRRERLDLTGAIHQAEADAKKFHDGQPAVFHRKNRQGWLVTMTLDEWISLYERACRILPEIAGFQVKDEKGRA